jgi:hypothetical protein
VGVPAQAEIAITMKADNWAFGQVEGRPREAGTLSERPAGTDKPLAGS